MMQDSMTIKCKYPIGIQTFSRIISEGYIYVDKTDFVWKLVLKAFLQQEVTSFWFEGSDMQAGQPKKIDMPQPMTFAARLPHINKKKRQFIC